MSVQIRYETGDRVEWNTGQGKAQGTVKEVLHESKIVAGNCIDGSEDDPRYVVENDSTGNVTGHTASALSKISDSKSDSKDAFQPGDKVQWNSAQGKVKGEVKQKLTSKTQIKGHTAKASEDQPQYLVESENTGSKAAHKPDSLDPI